jgi:prolipoprotein diacylglyceryltransferase
MKKNLIALSLILFVLALPVLVFAQPSKTYSSIDPIIQRVQTLAWQIFGLIAVIAFIIAGILFLTSGGDPEKVQTARHAFMWGVAGVIVGILAFSIMAIIQTAL